MTVFQYLEKVRNENPQYQRLDNVSLYKQLKGTDQNLPSWSRIDNPSKSTRRKTDKQSPGFLNSLFDWTDYGINQTSWNFVKSAYNNSITGLAYQLHNGEEKFDLEDYNPGIIEDIGSMVLSFAMPLDFASMFVGGYLGKALTKPMNAGIKAKAVDAMVGKKAFTKQFGKEITDQTTQKALKKAGKNITSEKARREIAERHVESIIKDYGMAPLYKQKSQAIAAGTIMNASTLATFEGVRGGFQAAANGEDVWKGIGTGVMHGGFMGALSGAVGSSLNIKHGQYLAKYADDEFKTFAQKAKLIGTGVPGQIVAESLAFSPLEIKQAITDPDYGMEELMRAFAVNAGMMGVLKAKGKLWEKGKNELGKWAESEGMADYIEAKEILKSVDNLKNSIDDMPEDTPAQKIAKNAARDELSEFRNNQIKNAKIKVEDYEQWEAEFDNATKIIEGIKSGKIKDVSAEDVVNVMRQIQAVRGAMIRNKAKGKAVTSKELPPEQIKQNLAERDAEIKRLENLEQEWIDNIEKPLEKLLSTTSTNVSTTKQSRVSWIKAMDDAKQKNRKNQINELREGLEGAVDAEGNIIDVAKFDELIDRADVNRKAYDEAYRPISVKQQGDYDQLAKQEAGEKFEKIVEGLPELKQSKNPDVESKLKSLRNKDSKIQNKEYSNPDGDTLAEQVGAYNISKKVLSFMARKFLPESKGGNQGTQLGHAESLANMLAKKGKSLFDVTDQDIRDWIESHTSIPRASVSKLIQTMQEISKIKKRKGRELFSEDLTYIDNRDIGKLVGELFTNIKNKGGRTGARIPGKEDKFTSYNSNGKITMSSKTGFIEKYTSKNVIKKIKSLIKKVVKRPTREGHEGYLFKVKDGSDYVAIRIPQINAIIKELFGQRSLSKEAGEGRLFRKAISQWAAEKYKSDSAEALIVFQHITGHGGNASNVKLTYEGSISKAELPGKVQGILKEFIKDVKNPPIDPKTGKPKIYGGGKQGYTTKEIATGFEKLQKRLKTKEDNVFEYTDSKGKKQSVTIDNATLETMVDYMVNTGPRLNEVGITDVVFKTIEDINAKNQLDVKLKAGQSLVDARTLADQVKWVKQKFPKLSVNIEKTLGKVNGQYVLGKIHGHMIKIAADKAKFDTLPHEVSHHVVDVLKDFGDPMSKKIVNDGIRMFKKKGMNDAQAEEAFVQALGEYTSKTLKQGMVGRMKSWVKRAVSYMRNYFGMRNQSDIDGMKKDMVRIIGGKVLSGKIPTDYLDLNARLEVKYQTSGTPTGKRTLKILRDDIKKAQEDARSAGANDKMLRDIEKDVLKDDRTIDSDTVTGDELMQIRENHKLVFDTIIEGKSPEYAANHAKVKNIEAQYDISEAQRDLYFERFQTSFEKATPEMIDTYKSYVAMGEKVKPMQGTLTDELKQIGDNKVSGTLPIWKRAFFKAADVIRMYAPRIARKLELHDFTRSFELKGPGERRIAEIKRIVKDKTVRNRFMHMIDPELASNAIKQLKKLSKQNKKKYHAEYVRALNAKTSFEKGGKYFEAAQIWKKTSDFYWNSLKIAIKKNSKSNAEYKQMIDGLNEIYIQQYFVRRPTREVAKYLHENHSAIQKMTEKAIKDLSIDDLKEIKKKGETPEEAVAKEIMQMLRFGPTTASPSYLKKRGVTLPEYIEIPDKNGRKKLVKSYESDIDATMQTYVNGMSKFIATVKHFPEFTELGGKFSLQSTTSKDLMDNLKAGNGNTDAIYAYETMRKQLGIDQNLIDVLNQPVSEIIGKVTNLSAVLGLSSPMAGLKNVMIQLPRSIAVYGLKNTYKGFTKAMHAIRNVDSRAWLEAVERGETGYGQKELLFGADKKIKWWFENVNLMEKTENLNRIMTAEAGRLHFAELVTAFKGEGSGFFPKAKAAEINRMFTDVFRLSDDQIKHIKETKDLHNSVEYEDILNYVGFSAHKASAGATGVSDLPLWMSNKYFKPLTLFQRMAYSVTIDSYKNYVKPLKNGNVAPLLKATFGHMATGAALYAMYDKLMGQQIPTEENSALDRAISNIWRGEMLGVFGEAISPYTARGNINPLMEPVIVRNITSATKEISNMFLNGKPVDMALKDFARQTVIIGVQAEKIFDRATNPYAVNLKRIASLESNWRKQSGKGYEKAAGGVLKERHYAYRNLRNAISLNYSDDDIARAYYVAYNTLISERIEGNYTDMRENEKYAKRSILTMIKKMNPLDISNQDKGRLLSKKNEFLNSLSEKNKNLALKTEKEYQYRVRKFERIISKFKFKKAYANHL